MQIIPVPPLKETLQKFAVWAEPFLSENEQAELEAKLGNFETALAPLQTALEVKGKKEKGYLYDDWIESYLEGRDSLPISTNFAVEIFPNDLDKDELYLNNFVKGLSMLASVYQQGKFPNQVDGRGTSIDMRAFKILGGYCRLPKVGKDEVFLPTKAGILPFLRIMLFMDARF